MMRAALVFLLLAGCTSLPPAAFEPVGHSTYGSLPDGRKVRLWTDNATGTTTGTIGSESVHLRTYGTP